MRDWNVVVSVRDGGFARARRLLQPLGPVGRTGFYNVLVMKFDDTSRLLEALRERVDQDPTILGSLARIMPAARTFDFQSPEEFEARAREAALAWVPDLAGKAFHVRLHRRGLKGRLPSPEEERFLDEAVLEAPETAGTPGRISLSRGICRGPRRPARRGGSVATRCVPAAVFVSTRSMSRLGYPASTPRGRP
jgi:hypothetical protein